MKICTTCKNEKDDAEFSIKNEGLSRRCRVCVAAYYKAYYNNPTRKKSIREAVKKFAKKRSKEVHAWVDGLKNKPCSDCGRSFPPICMDFDHLPEFQKNMSISKMISRGFATEKILAEIAKCELVCACCHRIRTENRSNAL